MEGKGQRGIKGKENNVSYLELLMAYGYIISQPYYNLSAQVMLCVIYFDPQEKTNLFFLGQDEKVSHLTDEGTETQGI